jgi:glucokinase
MHSPVVLGLDFGGTKIAVAVCDLSGTRLGETTIETLAEQGARASLERGILAAKTLLDDVAPGRELAAVGAATFGIPGNDGIALAPAIPGWSELALGRELGGAFIGAEIRLATDVKAAAQAEAEWGALVGCDPGIYLNLGTGLAVAVVSAGSVLSGAHGAAGEIGYNLRSIGDVGQVLAQRTPLEDVVSGSGFLRSASRLMPEASTAAEIYAKAAEDPRIGRLIREFVDELAFHLVNLVIAINPIRVAVGGGMVRSWQHLEASLRRALDAAVPYPPELVLASFPFDAPLVGALALGTVAARARQARGAPELAC